MENSNDEQFENAMHQYEHRRDAICKEVMQELYARLPYGEKFQLSDGSVGFVKKLAEPYIRDGRTQFSFDVIIEGGKLDHLEFVCKNTGGGGAV